MSRRESTAKAKVKSTGQQEGIHLWKQHFENLLGNHPKVTHEPITRIIWKKIVIRQGPFNQEELDSLLRKIKIDKEQGSINYPQKYGRPDNSMTYCTDTVMPYIVNPRDRWMKGCILLFLKKGYLELPRYSTYNHSGQNIQCPIMQPHSTQN